MLISLPEKRERIIHFQPSLMRIFRGITIDKLTDEEVSNFILRAFDKVNIKVEEEAIELMVRYSGGLPILMQEIGDATYLIDDDQKITYKDALSGIISAAENVRKKYLDPKVYKAIKSKRYRTILKKLARQPYSRTFKKKEIEAKLTEAERKVFNNFLKRMRELGIIERDIEEGRGLIDLSMKYIPFIFGWKVKSGKNDLK